MPLKELNEIFMSTEITELMAKSRNFEELRHIWTEWHRNTGGKMRLHYQKFVELSNEAARSNSWVIYYYLIF